MSANYLVDLGGTCLVSPTITASGGFYGLSGSEVQQNVGTSVDMLHANSFTNVVVAGIPFSTSGQLRVAVQTSDTDTSGNYTDPTSGLAQLPTWFQSGGILIINSGGLLGGTLQGAINAGGGLGNTQGTSGTANSGYFIQSGFTVAGGFQRNLRYARALIVSGDTYNGSVNVAFVAQLKTTGSGGGFSYQPSSGAVFV